MSLSVDLVSLLRIEITGPFSICVSGRASAEKSIDNMKMLFVIITINFIHSLISIQSSHPSISVSNIHPFIDLYNDTILLPIL